MNSLLCNICIIKIQDFLSCSVLDSCVFPSLTIIIIMSKLFLVSLLRLFVQMSFIRLKNLSTIVVEQEILIDILNYETLWHQSYIRIGERLLHVPFFGLLVFLLITLASN